VAVTVSTNAAPVVTGESTTVTANSTGNSIEVLSNDTDPENDNIRVLTATATCGTVTTTFPTGWVTPGTSQNISYNAPASGPCTINYTVEDAFGGTTGGSVAVTVNTVPPFTAWNESFASYAIGSGTRPTWSNWTGMNPNNYSGCNGSPPSCTPWTILNTQTGSSTTSVGPSQGATGSGTNFIYTEASGTTTTYGVGIASGDINYLESNGTLDASLYSFTLTYYYNMNFNADTTGTHTVQVYNGSSWDSVAGTAFGTGGITGDQHTSTQWTQNTVDLSSFRNADLAIRLQIQAGTGSSFYYDFGIDEIQVTGTIR